MRLTGRFAFSANVGAPDTEAPMVLVQHREEAPETTIFAVASHRPSPAAAAPSRRRAARPGPASPASRVRWVGR